jgi:hypothetical protein
MSKKRLSRRDLQTLCSELAPEDGQDPRLDPRSSSGKVANRKALQLCGQVAETLAVFLAGCGDDVLRDVVITSVVPAPNSSRLLVTVTVSAAEAQPEQVLACLQRALPRLRVEVGFAITRKRVPELAFRVMR